MVRIHQANQIEVNFSAVGSDEVYGNGGHDIFTVMFFQDGIEVDFAKGTASHVAKFSGIEEVRGSRMTSLQQ